MVPEHPRSGLGTGGIRRLDWARPPAVATARRSTAGTASCEARTPSQLVLSRGDITPGTKQAIWRIRPRRTSAKNWSPGFREEHRGSRLRLEWTACGFTERVSGPGHGVGSWPWQAGRGWGARELHRARLSPYRCLAGRPRRPSCEEKLRRSPRSGDAKTEKKTFPQRKLFAD